MFVLKEVKECIKRDQRVCQEGLQGVSRGIKGCIKNDQRCFKQN